MSEWTDDEGRSLGKWEVVEVEEYRELVAQAGGIERLTVFSSLTDPEGQYGPAQIYTAWGRREDAVPLVDSRDYKTEDGSTTRSILRKFVREPRWNGELCRARRVRVVVADNPKFPLYWARHMVGSERAAVEVTYSGRTFYIDDEGFDQRPEIQEYLRAHDIPVQHHIGHPGWGWEKVMAGGGPGHAHASLQVERVLPEEVRDDG